MAGWPLGNERSFMMNHTDGWMCGWIGGGMPQMEEVAQEVENTIVKIMKEAASA
jgi:hypothetical protein